MPTGIGDARGAEQILPRIRDFHIANRATGLPYAGGDALVPLFGDPNRPEIVVRSWMPRPGAAQVRGEGRGSAAAATAMHDANPQWWKCEGRILSRNLWSIPPDDPAGKDSSERFAIQGDQRVDARDVIGNRDCSSDGGYLNGAAAAE